MWFHWSGLEPGANFLFFNPNPDNYDLLKLDKLGGLASPWRPCLHVSEVRIRPPIVDNIDRFRIEDTAHKTISTGATHTRNAVCIPSSFGLPKWRRGKEPACQRRRYGFHLQVGKIPWRRKWQPTPVFLPGEFHGQRSLADYSPRVRKRVGHDWVTEHACILDNSSY